MEIESDIVSTVYTVIRIDYKSSVKLAFIYARNTKRIRNCRLPMSTC